MNRDPDILERVDRFLDGQASPADEASIREAAAEDPAVIKALFVRALLDQDMREHFQASAAQESTPARRADRSPWVRRALALAATVLVAVGVGVLVRPDASVPVRVSVTRCIKSPKAVVVRNGATLPLAEGDSIQKGDRILVKGPGALELSDSVEGVRVVLGDHGEMHIGSGTQYNLASGRAHVVADKRADRRGALRFSGAQGVVEVTGTEFVLRSDSRSSRVRVVDGAVRFRAARGGDAVTVAAGECAMVHQDRAAIYKVDYKPGRVFEGDVVFADDFEAGNLDRWMAVLLDDDGGIHPVPPNLPAAESWVQVDRDGLKTGCMRLQGVPRQTNGWYTLLPRQIPPLDGFIMELDVSYENDSVSMAFLSQYYDAYFPTIDNPEEGRIWTQFARSRRWGKVRVELKGIAGGDQECSHHSRFKLDGEVLQDWLYFARAPARLSLKPKKGSVRVDNVVVRELLSFD